MTNILREMCNLYEQGHHRSNEEAMQAALLFLAENVSDKMVEAGMSEPTVELAISSALRVAASFGRPIAFMEDDNE